MEIYTLINGQPDKLLYVFTNKQLIEINAVFEHFQAACGIKINLYGDTKFSSGNAGLISSVSAVLNKNSKTRTDVVEVLTNNEQVIFVGD